MEWRGSFSSVSNGLRRSPNLLVCLAAALLTGCAATPKSPASNQSESTEMKLRKSKVISVSVRAAPNGVYAFVLNAENMPKWMTSFVRSVRKSEGKWIADTSAGQMEFRFVPRNEFG